jgi:hypothetical protein
MCYVRPLASPCQSPSLPPNPQRGPRVPPLKDYGVHTNRFTKPNLALPPLIPPYQGGKYLVLPLTKGELEGVMQDVCVSCQDVCTR